MFWYMISAGYFRLNFRCIFYFSLDVAAQKGNKNDITDDSNISKKLNIKVVNFSRIFSEA